jgi:hypothetical protein
VDAEGAVLASTAAATMVTLLTTDAWIQVKKEIGGLWRRVRPAEADAVVAEIERSRGQAAGSADDSAVMDALKAEWTGRLTGLLAARAAAAELGRTHSVLEALLPQEPGRDVSIRQTAKARGGSAVVQVAGSLYGGVRLAAARAWA